MAETDRQKTYILGILTLVYAFNFIDRQILGILAPFIALDLGFDDSRIGLLTGFYFALFYTTLALPIAWLADRANRVTIVAVSLAIWSAFTVLSGFVTSFAMLALMRIGVAIGEAGGSPPSHSIISDLFKPEERARSLAIYSLGIPLGIMLAYFISASLAGAEDTNWRLILIVVGIPGILLAAVLKLTVKDPPRGQFDKTPNSTSVPFLPALKQLLSIKSYWAMCFGIAFASFTGYALSAFLVTYVLRAFPGVPVPSLLIALGVINGTTYAGGVFVGGIFAERWAKKTVAGYAFGPALGVAIAALALIAALVTRNYTLYLILIAIYLFFAGFYLGPSLSVAQNLAPTSVRATSSAIFFFVLNMIALGGGPTIAGMISTHYAEEYGVDGGLRIALFAMVIPLILSVISFLIAGRWLPADWAKAQAASSPPGDANQIALAERNDSDPHPQRAQP